MRRAPMLLATLPLLAPALSCGRDAPKPVLDPAVAPSAGSPASTARPDPAAASAVAPRGSPIVFQPPAEWKEESPSNRMRKAQFRLARVEGDAEDVEVTLSYFGSGGTVEDNIARWCGQFTQPDGSDSRAALQRSSRKVNGMAVEEVQLSGIYNADTMTPGTESVRKPGFRMLAAIVSSDHGLYFLKLTGPEKTVTKWQDSFTAFVSSARAQ